MIKAPNENPKDDNLECQEALEPSFLAVIDEAVKAGWSREQVIKSLGDLVDNLWFDDQAFPDDPSVEKKAELPAVGSFS
ncbi:hypothetical protein [Rhizobium sp. Root1204]|uniref:hypothetical protein n=1 Tax=Rhizobium sp. Root1204 TaxID=1736428 RepID=UPI0007156344|nr:hypothetical protein [Rhizobium sp. Root1204]KQV36370.1 hypothetical protein ASC96_28300 [Rhizobium sp. Root1204]